MNISPMTSATNMISAAQQKAASAAETIARLPVQDQEVGSTEPFQSTDLIKPILSLNEAEFETSAATKIIKAHDSMLGSLFDAVA
jgi:hypothetical protein